LVQGLIVTIQLRAYDHGREEGFRAISARLWKLCSGLATVAPELSSWQGKLGSAFIPLMGERDIETVVASAARMWRSGDKEHVAYGPSAIAEYQGLRTAKIGAVAGVAPTDLPAWVPNQTEVEIKGAGESEMRRDPARVLAALQALVVATQPAWAVVALDDDPKAPVPPFADGTPSVGWMTYLSSVYPPLPAQLPQPAITYDMGTGVIIVANSSKPDHAAIERVAHALIEARVLVPASSVRPQARA
jgi:hypothetical protein